jgi:asparagine synthase (glutamine-hydrolysing)
MRRLLAGTFDPRGRGDHSRLSRALAPRAGMFLHRGALRVAFTGDARAAGEPLCLLDGFLDDQQSLAKELGAPPDMNCEQLLGAGYRRWGAGLLGRLRGDFALLIWDGAQGEGLLARDQLGVRCLYLSDVAGSLSFAGEIHHLLALLPTRPAPDPVGVAHLIALSGRPGSGTVYAGIRRLNPGSYLLLDRHGAREQRYWAPRYIEPQRASSADLAEQTRSALDVAVGRRISAAGETGVLMSGGLDSASVAAVAASLAPGRISAYAGVFPDHPAVDESALIAQLRATLGLSGIDMEVRPGGLLESVVESVCAWQAPVIGWGDFWTSPLMRAAASDGVSTMLGGDGGDELFGPRAYLLADALRHGHPRRSLQLALRLPGAGERPRRREVAKVLGNLAIGGALPYRLHTALWRGVLPKRLPPWLLAESAHDILASDDPYAWKCLGGPRWWAHLAHGLTRGVEEVGIFEHHRRRAAAAGLQARHPLFDLDLLELTLRQPPEASLDPHRNRPLLRASMAGLLPDEIRLRPAKAWFDSLILDALRAEDLRALRRMIASPGSELAAYVDVGALASALFDEHAGGADSFRWMHQLWRLLSVECWLRLQADPSADALRAAMRPSPARLRARRA